jgi:hypothetical protein
MWIYGSFLVLAGWVIYSRLYAYVVGPLLIVSKPIVDGLVIVLVIVLALVDLVLRPVIAPLHRLQVRRWLARHRRSSVAKSVERGISPEAAERDYEAWLRGHGESALRTLADGEVFFRDGMIVGLAGPVGDALLSPLRSRVRIGLAPLADYGTERGLAVPASPVQIYGTAIAGVQALLAGVRGIDDVRFYTLPSAFVISSAGWAEFFRRLFRLDLLLWGRYEEDRATAVAFVASPRHENRAAQQDDSRDTGLRFQSQLFPDLLDPAFPDHLTAITFSTQAEAELHGVLLACLLEAVGTRPRFQRRRFLDAWDRVRLNRSQITDAVEAHLVLDLLPLTPGQALPPAILPSVWSVVVDLAGRWAGYQLGYRSFAFDDDRWLLHGEERFKKVLSTIVDRSAALMPGAPEHAYRQGAIKCLLEDETAAREAFARAGRLSEAADRIRPIAGGVLAQDALETADRAALSDRDRALACYAAHAACVINAGSVSGMRDLREHLSRSTTVTMARAGVETLPRALLLVDALLTEAGVGPPLEDGEVREVSKSSLDEAPHV